MFKHRFDQNVDNSVVMHWLLLSMSGGFINAGGFLATGRFVSHVTGFATLFGVDLSNSQVEAAFGILSVPVFFLIGAFIAGLLIDRPIHKGERPRFDWVMGISTVALLLAATGGELLQFGEFGKSIKLEKSYVLLVLLCLASGLQNAAITSSSSKSVRATHLTGLTTDLGLGLARIFAFQLKQRPLQIEVRANFLRVGSIAAFIAGSALGAWVFLKLGFIGFVFPAVISAYAAWQSRETD
jgi:uncharacterized membrane protein YoaK (UPF0700 family)